LNDRPGPNVAGNSSHGGYCGRAVKTHRPASRFKCGKKVKIPIVASAEIGNWTDAA